MSAGPTPQRRLEIVHESLLSNWPRLVRWRTQDAEGAQLRDDLRQAAGRWQEKGRPDDLLWTGTSYREFELWRERYPGGLTAGEAEFATAMVGKALRHKRRVRLAVGLAFVLLLGILAVVWISRRQAVVAREDAVLEARRAAAHQLLALGQLELGASPTLALAHATKSLELADNPEARLFALRALAAGPPATILPLEDFAQGMGPFHFSFSSDGNWAAFGGRRSLQAVSRDGATRAPIEPFELTRNAVRSTFDPSGRYLYGANKSRLGVWSLPGFEPMDEQQVPLNAIRLIPTPEALIVVSTTRRDAEVIDVRLTRHVVGTSPREIGGLGLPCPRPCQFDVNLDRSGRWIAYPQSRELWVRSVSDWSRPPRLLGSHPAPIQDIQFDPDGSRVAAYDTSHSAVRIWPFDPGATGPLRILEANDFSNFAFDPTGRRLVAYGSRLEHPWVYEWDLTGPIEAQPRAFPGSLVGAAGESLGIAWAEHTPDGRWLVTVGAGAAGFWPLGKTQPRVFSVEDHIWDVEFTPDGEFLVTGRENGTVTLWPLGSGGASRALVEGDAGGAIVAVDPKGRFIAVDHFSNTLPCGVSIVPLDGSPPRTFVGFASDSLVISVGVDSEGRLAAVGTSRGQQGDPLIKVWDVETGEVQDLGRREAPGQSLGGVTDIRFLPDGSLLSNGSEGLAIWSLADGSQRLVAPSLYNSLIDVFDDGRRVVHQVETATGSALAVTDLATQGTVTLPEHGDRVSALAADPAGRFLVSGDEDGLLRVSLASSGEPHLLFGHTGRILDIRVSPDGRWIASAGKDRTIRLWPVPDLATTPLHALPHEDLVARLHRLTNVRVVEDLGSTTGWSIEIGPFPGWEEVPKW